MTHRTMSERFYHGATSRSWKVLLNMFILYTKKALNDHHHIEKLYYACRYEPCCIQCDGVEDEADNYPQCEDCHDPPIQKKRRKEMFYLTTHSTHFIYGYKASDIWLRTIPIVRKETRCRHIGYSYRLTVRVLLYTPSHRQDSTYLGFVTPVVEHRLQSKGGTELYRP